MNKHSNAPTFFLFVHALLFIVSKNCKTVHHTTHVHMKGTTVVTVVSVYIGGRIEGALNLVLVGKQGGISHKMSEWLTISSETLLPSQNL